MKRKIILIAVFILFHLISIAQVKFTNPGFEDTPHDNTPPEAWDLCSGTPDCNSYEPAYPWYLPPYQGSTYLGLGFDQHTESSGQYIKCNLTKGKKHHFTLYAYEISYIVVQFSNPGGRVRFFGGESQCDLDTLLWQSPSLDTLWQQYSVEFIPNKDYNYVTFVSNNINNKPCYIGIDNLSDITVDNYNLLSLPFSDTTVIKEGCVNLIANSDDASGHFVWSSIPSGFNASGGMVSVCPTQNTKYVCIITSGCGWQKSDTVNVEVTPNGVENIKGGEYLSIYPNPTSNLLQLSNLPIQTSALQYSIINTLGQVKQSNALTPGNTSASINVSTLPVGVYFIRLTGSKGVVYSGKFVKE